jgi:hypothetical protein
MAESKDDSSKMTRYYLLSFLILLFVALDIGIVFAEASPESGQHEPFGPNFKSAQDWYKPILRPKCVGYINVTSANIRSGPSTKFDPVGATEHRAIYILIREVSNEDNPSEVWFEIDGNVQKYAMLALSSNRATEMVCPSNLEAIKKFGDQKTGQYIRSDLISVCKKLILRRKYNTIIASCEISRHT